MMIDFSATIQNEPDGPTVELETVIDACLDYEYGERVVAVTDVFLKGYPQSLYRGQGKMFSLMAGCIASQAESDQRVLQILIEGARAVA